MAKFITRTYTDPKTQKTVKKNFKVGDNYNIRTDGGYDDARKQNYKEAYTEQPSFAKTAVRAALPSVVGAGLGALSQVGQGGNNMARAASALGGTAVSNVSQAAANYLNRNYDQSKLAAVGAGAISTGGAQFSDANARNIARGASVGQAAMSGLGAGAEGLLRGAANALPGGTSLAHGVSPLLGGIYQAATGGGWNSLLGGIAGAAGSILSSKTLGDDMSKWFQKSKASDYAQGTWGQVGDVENLSEDELAKSNEAFLAKTQPSVRSDMPVDYEVEDKDTGEKRAGTAADWEKDTAAQEKSQDELAAFNEQNARETTLAKGGSQAEADAAATQARLNTGAPAVTMDEINKNYRNKDGVAIFAQPGDDDEGDEGGDDAAAAAPAGAPGGAPGGAPPPDDDAGGGGGAAPAAPAPEPPAPAAPTAPTAPTAPASTGVASVPPPAPPPASAPAAAPSAAAAPAPAPAPAPVSTGVATVPPAPPPPAPAAAPSAAPVAAAPPPAPAPAPAPPPAAPKPAAPAAPLGTAPTAPTGAPKAPAAAVAPVVPPGAPAAVVPPPAPIGSRKGTSVALGGIVAPTGAPGRKGRLPAPPPAPPAQPPKTAAQIQAAMRTGYAAGAPPAKLAPPIVPVAPGVAGAPGDLADDPISALRDPAAAPGSAPGSAPGGSVALASGHGGLPAMPGAAPSEPPKSAPKGFADRVLEAKRVARSADSVNDLTTLRGMSDNLQMQLLQADIDGAPPEVIREMQGALNQLSERARHLGDIEALKKSDVAATPGGEPPVVAAAGTPPEDYLAMAQALVHQAEHATDIEASTGAANELEDQIRRAEAEGIPDDVIQQLRAHLATAQERAGTNVPEAEGGKLKPAAAVAPGVAGAPAAAVAPGVAGAPAAAVAPGVAGAPAAAPTAPGTIPFTSSSASSSSSFGSDDFPVFIPDFLHYENIEKMAKSANLIQKAHSKPAADYLVAQLEKKVEKAQAQGAPDDIIQQMQMHLARAQRAAEKVGTTGLNTSALFTGTHIPSDAEPSPADHVALGNLFANEAEAASTPEEIAIATNHLREQIQRAEREGVTGKEMDELQAHLARAQEVMNRHLSAFREPAATGTTAPIGDLDAALASLSEPPVTPTGAPGHPVAPAAAVAPGHPVAAGAAPEPPKSSKLELATEEGQPHRWGGKEVPNFNTRELPPEDDDEEITDETPVDEIPGIEERNEARAQARAAAKSPVGSTNYYAETPNTHQFMEGYQYQKGIAERLIPQTRISTHGDHDYERPRDNYIENENGDIFVRTPMGLLQVEAGGGKKLSPEYKQAVSRISDAMSLHEVEPDEAHVRDAEDLYHQLPAEVKGYKQVPSEEARETAITNIRRDIGKATTVKEARTLMDKATDNAKTWGIRSAQLKKLREVYKERKKTIRRTTSTETDRGRAKLTEFNPKGVPYDIRTPLGDYDWAMYRPERRTLARLSAERNEQPSPTFTRKQKLEHLERREEMYEPLELSHKDELQYNLRGLHQELTDHPEQAPILDARIKDLESRLRHIKTMY